MDKKKSIRLKISYLFCFVYLLCNSLFAFAGGDQDDLKTETHNSDAWYLQLGDDWDGSSVNVFFDEKINDFHVLYSTKDTYTTEGTGTVFDWSSMLFFSNEAIRLHVDWLGYVIKYGRPNGEFNIAIDNDQKISVQRLDARPSSRCPQELNRYLKLATKIKDAQMPYDPNWHNEDHNSAEKPIKRISYLYKLPVAQEEVTNKTCATNPGEEYLIKYVALGGKLVDMFNDDSFLFLGPISTPTAGLIIRLNQDLSLHGNICEIENLIFVDTEDIRALYQFEDMSYQQLQNDIEQVYKRRRSELCP